jgi:regulator of RNase E activity RraA
VNPLAVSSEALLSSLACCSFPAGVVQISLNNTHTNIQKDTHMTISAETLDGLQKYDTPTVCNVIELFEVRPRSTGYMDKSIQACYPKLPPMVGYALTSEFRALSPPRGADVYGGMDAQLESIAAMDGPPVIVFQDLDVPSAAATFGEVMCSTYKSFGAAGLITSGTGRDLEQVEVLDFPAFTAGTCCSHGACHILSVNVPVVVGGITIYPNDLLHGDCNGVTTIPDDIASEIPEACAEFMKAESHVIDYVKAGTATSAGFAEARDAMSADVKALGARLRRS